jgi:hypothetical protein
VRLVAPLLLAAVLVLPRAAGGAYCSPLDCAPSQFTLAHGTMLAVRVGVDKPVRVIDLRTGTTRWWLPPGIVTGETLVHRDGRLLTWYDLATGARLRDALLQTRGTFALVGASQDARRAVLARTQRLSTTFAIVSPAGQRTIRVGGSNWQFDALNGEFLYLVQDLSGGYRIRLFDLARNRLRPQPLKSAGDPATISAAPVARASTPDGRYLLTVYVTGDGRAMVHELDTAAGAAYCIDLPGSGDAGKALTWALVPDVDAGTVWAVSVGYGQVVGIDLAARVVRLHFGFHPGRWLANPGVGVLAPDGDHIAVTDAEHTWIVTPARGRVARGPSHVAIALGYSPDQRRLWVVGERSRVSALRVR